MKKGSSIMMMRKRTSSDYYYYGNHFMVSEVAIVLIYAVLMGNVGESNAEPATAVDCSSLALTMADCLSFVTSGSTVQKPEGNCCSGLKTTLKTDASCLCEGFKNSAQLGITLNVSKALTLPAACHVSAPSISNCGLNINLNGAPAASPVASSPRSAATIPQTSSATAEVDALPIPESSDSSIIPGALPAIPVLVLLAYFSLFFC